jgi:hypothetical protein
VASCLAETTAIAGPLPDVDLNFAAGGAVSSAYCAFGQRRTAVSVEVAVGAIAIALVKKTKIDRPTFARGTAPKPAPRSGG